MIRENEARVQALELLRLEGGVFAWDEETKSIALEEIEDALRTAVDAVREDLCADTLVKVRPTQRPVSITLTFVPLAKVAGCAPHRLHDGAPDTDCDSGATEPG